MLFSDSALCLRGGFSVLKGGLFSVVGPGSVFCRGRVSLCRSFLSSPLRVSDSASYNLRMRLHTVTTTDREISCCAILYGVCAAQSGGDILQQRTLFDRTSTVNGVHRAPGQQWSAFKKGPVRLLVRFRQKLRPDTHLKNR